MQGAPLVKFARKNYFPPGWEVCTAQFLELFHRYGYIYKPLSGGSWYSANEQWKLTDSEILKAIACAHPKHYVGCRAGKSTRFAVLDIDVNSKYHSKHHLDKLLHALSDAGLSKSSLYRSSFSGGWHLYIFFDEPINSSDLRAQLIKLLTLNQFHVAKGTLEIFPHPGDVSLGMGLRLPLQPGWAWLDQKTLDIDYERSELSPTAALELFVDALDGDANSFADFRKLKSHIQELESRKTAAAAHGLAARADNVVPIRRPDHTRPGDFTEFVGSVFNILPPGIIVDTWYAGRVFHLDGLSGPSQRAEAIYCLSHYLFYGDPSRELPALGYGYEQEREWAISEFLSARHNGQSKDINRCRADALAQVERAANWRPAHKKKADPKKYSSARPVSWIRENANRKTDARKRIQDALDALKKLRRSFTTVELQEAAGCSRETLYKHADIWRKDYEDLAAGLFAICTDEYNAVVRAGSSETKPATTTEEKIAPPGLLAARRVIYEISMRGEREKRHTEKGARNSREESETKWLDEVTRLTEKQPSALSIPQLKAMLTVLAAYLALAPNEEGQILVQLYIDQIRQRLSTANEKPLFVVRPP